jgi:hypothetical protein
MEEMGLSGNGLAQMSVGESDERTDTGRAYLER